MKQRHVNNKDMFNKTKQNMKYDFTDTVLRSWLIQHNGFPAYILSSDWIKLTFAWDQD